MKGKARGVIEFHYDSVHFNLDETRIKNWITKVVSQYKKDVEEIQIIFCTDEALLKLNREHLQHDYYTDVITFEYMKEPIMGDIYISLERVRENAKEFGVSEVNELFRVIIHGILHILGFSDKSKRALEKMRKAEDDALKMLE